MRRRRNYFATHASLTGQGSSKSEANADLERQIDWALVHRDPYVESRFQSVIVVAASASGWHCTLMRPDQISVHGTKACWMMAGQCDFAPLLRSARINAAQCAWSFECDDDAHAALAGLDENGARELLSWCVFQRQYAAAKQAGKSDAEAFDIAQGRKAA